MKVKFLEPARLEYQEAIDFYNLQSERLGDKFISEIDRTISIIKNFPYSIIYTIHKNHIEILAIAHQHRKPNYWLKR